MGLGLSAEFEFYHRSDVIFSQEGNISSLLNSGGIYFGVILWWQQNWESSRGGLEVERRLPIQCEEGVSYLGGSNPAVGVRLPTHCPW